MTFAIPPRPDEFTPEGVAPGCQRIPNLYDRPLTTYRMDVLCVHTNWAGGEGSIRAAMNWSLSDQGSNTYAHYQHDLNGDAAKMLDSNRRGIGNDGTSAYWDQYGLPRASHRALVFETADRGTRTDPAPEGSYFTDVQMASLARDLAYECVVHGIPPVVLDRPEGRGICGHTWPFPYPAFTTASTKKCPGYRKIAQLEATVIPWTAAIVAAWTAPPPHPDPPEEDDLSAASDAILAELAELSAKVDALAAAEAARERTNGARYKVFTDRHQRELLPRLDRIAKKLGL